MQGRRRWKSRLGNKVNIGGERKTQGAGLNGKTVDGKRWVARVGVLGE